MERRAKSCEISRENRICQYCRHQKCLQVGMTKDKTVQRPKQKLLRKECKECMKKAGLEKVPKILNAEKGQSRSAKMMEEKQNAMMKGNTVESQSDRW
ncbi:hypothetical protein B9Z55_022905 [Caenorhabditis nigoni]|nr:hypothetical protein B9Z55_022905 [Caenorhabditis nigoni]